MVTLCLFQTNLPFPCSCKPYRTQFCRLRFHKQNWPPETLTRLRRLHISASSNNKPSRNTRAVKSNEELCNEIRLFLDQVGLSQDHSPSIKDFMQHGRNDLANIVRRRGYKLIRELLENSIKVEFSVVDTDKRLDGVDAQEKIDAGQDGNVKKLDEDATSEITCEMVPRNSDHHEILKGQDKKIEVVTEETVLTMMKIPQEVRIAKADGNLEISEKVSNLNYELLEDLDSSYHDENTSGGAECNDQEVEVSLSSINKNSSEEINGTNSLADLSLEEKVAKFVQDGDLDTLEGGYGLIEVEDVDISSKVSGGEQSKKQDNKVAAEGHNSNSDKDLYIEATEQLEEQQISHLKLMLHEKELEFSRLKELIEKEKLALSVLQTVAETEINKAQKLVSEKDAELQFAEESLSGLMEVQIQFCGDGDTVELTGSFNGWHHNIKMDLEPSAASVTDPSGSRKSKLWSAVLWLYPGVYEIKFIVDGHWRTDPQKESVTRGHICNNILRVGR